jgi:hypothetical protein
MARISDEEMARRAEELVLKRIDAEDLGVPSLPLVAVRCIDLLANPDFSVHEVARAIESDPVVAARVVRLANSAARSTLEPAKSVIQSVMRLGADELQALMFEVSARPIFQSHDRTISVLGHELWAHSVTVAGSTAANQWSFGVHGSDANGHRSKRPCGAITSATGGHFPFQDGEQMQVPEEHALLRPGVPLCVHHSSGGWAWCLIRDQSPRASSQGY